MSKYKTLLIWPLLVLLVTKSFAQIEFVKGYFIDSNNQRIDCLIKNKEWKKNPREVIYKISENDGEKTLNVSDIKEFGIGKISRYVSTKIEIDRSSDIISQLNMDRNPIWESDYLFLEVLINGRISLLYFRDETIDRFFYQIGDTVQQLVHKKYLTESNTVKVNNTFRQQLLTSINCNNKSVEDVNKINCTKSDLKKYFIDYNKCLGVESTDYSSQIVRDQFNLKLTPGINYSTLSIIDATGYNNVYKADFEGRKNIRFGLEAEFVLPFNKNKWGVIVEPNYQTYNSTLMISNKAFFAQYNSLEIPVGLRYYMFLSKDSRFFINALIGKSVVVKSNLNWGFGPLMASPALDVSMGLGYNFKRISGEVRYCKNRDILNDYVLLQADYSRFLFILGLKLF